MSNTRARAYFLVVLTLGGLTAPLTSTAQAVPEPATFAYVLQADLLAPSAAAAVRKLTASGRDWIVLDVAYMGGRDWTAAEIARIRAGRANRKVIAYLSIGEAEDYRPYWNAAWDADRNGIPDAAAPAWLLGENPDWPGNYLVKYWYADWQRLILQALDRILSAGFDGIYLDIVDGFEHFEYDPVTGDWRDDLINPETGQSYRKDMIDWVGRLAASARASKGAGFMVIPQNGEQLLRSAAYRDIISAQGVESVFTDGNRPVSAADTRYRLAFLKMAKADQKPVLLIEYGTTAVAKGRSINGARKHQLRLLLTRPDLGRLGISRP